MVCMKCLEDTLTQADIYSIRWKCSGCGARFDLPGTDKPEVCKLSERQHKAKGLPVTGEKCERSHRDLTYEKLDHEFEDSMPANVQNSTEPRWF